MWLKKDHEGHKVGTASTEFFWKILSLLFISQLGKRHKGGEEAARISKISM